MTTWATRFGIGLLLAGTALLAGAPGASASEVAARPAASPAELPAHPLGNATTNQYVGVRVEPDLLVVDYVLDLAELPAYQFCGAAFGSAGCRPPSGQAVAAAADQCADIAGQVTVRAAGRDLVLAVNRSVLTFPPGSAGLLTARFECVLAAPVRIPAGGAVMVENTAYPGTVGWREVTAVGDRMTLRSTSVPARSVSNRLTGYPNELLSSPPDQRIANLVVVPGGPAVGDSATAAGPAAPLTRGVDRLSRAYTALIAHQQLTVGFALLAVVLAVGLGCLHAIAPGHGKTVMAAYLVGARGSARQAASIGLTVAATHTVGVLLLGTALSASAAVAPERVYPWLGLASGLLLAIVGIGMLRRAVELIKHRASGPHGPAHPRPQPHAHSHPHPHPHPHTHPHPHSHDHDHTGAVPPGPRLRSLIGMGVAGGLVPSPSALLVLLGGIALGRPWFGLLLVVAYGLGMAGLLTGIGLLLARGRALLERRARTGATSWRWPLAGRLTRALPVGTAALVLVVGIGVALTAARTLTG
jgi:ABC-type nickel/cobalt efflux system permease component RcnA